SGIEIALDDDDVLPVHLELLGDDHRQGGLHALADFGLFGNEGDDAVRCDADEGVGSEFSAGRGLDDFGRDRRTTGLEKETEHEAAARQRGKFQEIAAIDPTGESGRVHLAPPEAAAAAGTAASALATLVTWVPA